MDDGATLPPTFEEWEEIAKRTIGEAAKQGVTIKPVMLDPDEFLTYCKDNNFKQKGSRERASFAISHESAKGLN
jgi:hypothetical protein